jgi:exodeoxyribonuclease-3
MITMGKTIKLISWNVNGIRASVNKGFYELVAKLDPDILCIQETKAQNDIVEFIASKLDGYKLFVNSALKKGYSGTAIFDRLKTNNHALDIGIEEHDQEGRVIAVEHESFYLVNVYVPNSGQALDRLGYRKTWDDALQRYLKKLDNIKPVILTGDLNVAHEAIDLARPAPNYNKSAGYTQIEIDGFKGFLDIGLIDTYRHFYKDKVQYTFWNQRFNARANNVGWRIDYFLASGKIINKIKDSFILDDILGSDHCPVGIVMEV